MACHRAGRDGVRDHA